MKRFRFEIEGGAEFLCIAHSFRSACELFDQSGYDPHSILSIEER